MIALLYPFKMDKNISTDLSNLYNEMYKNFDPKKPDPKQVAAQAKQEQNRQKFNDPMGVKNTMKNSYEPEGEMVDEMKAPRMQKGAMAYDGPNKERSEAADRVLAKTKKKKKKMNEGAQEDAVDQIMGGGKRDAQKDAVKQYVKYSSKKKKMTKEETINELESRTMLNYIDKASDSASKELKKAKKAEKKGKFKKATKARLKMDKRESGIEMAKDKIMKKVKESKFRTEWEEMKLNEMNDYRSKFDEWLDNLVKEGYDIERWSDEELIDTFIDESNLWKSRDTIESALLESDKKGKGSGKKDACYKKVKASASVWPSAYASGRLVQCRKKGAANYGNSTKKEEFSNWRDELNIDEALATTSVIAGAALNRNKKMTGLTVKNTGNKSAV